MTGEGVKRVIGAWSWQETRPDARIYVPSIPPQYSNNNVRQWR